MIFWSILGPYAVLSMSIGFILIFTGILFTIFGRSSSSARLRKSSIAIGSIMVIFGYVCLEFFLVL